MEGSDPADTATEEVSMRAIWITSGVLVAGLYFYAVLAIVLAIL